MDKNIYVDFFLFTMIHESKLENTKKIEASIKLFELIRDGFFTGLISKYVHDQIPIRNDQKHIFYGFINSYNIEIIDFYETDEIYLFSKKITDAKILQSDHYFRHIDILNVSNYVYSKSTYFVTWNEDLTDLDFIKKLQNLLQEKKIKKELKIITPSELL